MNRHSIVSVALLIALPLLCPLEAGAAALTVTVPIVENKGIPAVGICGSTAAIPVAYYSDTIVFDITGQLIAGVSTDQAKLNLLPRGTPLDIKIRQSPSMLSDLKAKILSFLGAKTDFQNAQAITITSVTSAAVVCYPQGW